MPNRTDDETLEDDAVLLRRIVDKPAEWFTKESDGTFSISSAAFKDSTHENSVSVGSMISEEEVLKAGRPGDGLASIIAGVPRSKDCIVAKTLEPDDPPEPDHRVICPNPEKGEKITKGMARAMAKAANWIVLPLSAQEEQ